MTQNTNFSDIVVAIKEHAITQHGALIESRLQELLPQARIRFLSDFPTLMDTQTVDLLITAQFPWLPDLMQQCPALRWVHLLTSGTEVLDACAASFPDVRMTRSAGVNATAMAEYVLGAMLYHTKNLGRYAEQQREQQWQRYWSQDVGGKTMVILGTGPIGQEIARMAHALGVRCIGVSRSGSPAAGCEQVYPMQQIDRALPMADYLVIALPLKPETRNCIDASMLQKLPDSCVLIDVSRGGILNTQDLIEALRNQKLAGATLDVFESEPLPPDSPLWTTPNLLLTPHIAGTSDHFMQNALRIFAQYLEGAGKSSS